MFRAQSTALAFLRRLDINSAHCPREHAPVCAQVSINRFATIYGCTSKWRYIHLIFSGYLLDNIADLVLGMFWNIVINAVPTLRLCSTRIRVYPSSPNTEKLRVMPHLDSVFS